jgi:hypothetical protein
VPDSNDLVKNTNASDVAAAARERREQARLDAQRKKDKDKEDRYVLPIYCLTIKIKNLSWGQHWSVLTFDVNTTQEFSMKELVPWIFRNMARFFIFMVRL